MEGNKSHVGDELIRYGVVIYGMMDWQVGTGGGIYVGWQIFELMSYARYLYANIYHVNSIQ